MPRVQIQAGRTLLRFEDGSQDSRVELTQKKCVPKEFYPDRIEDGTDEGVRPR